MYISYCLEKQTDTVGAEIITELISFATEVCICNGNSFNIREDAVSAVMDFYVNFHKSLSVTEMHSNSG